MSGGLYCPGKTLNSPCTCYREVIEEETLGYGR